MTVEFVMPDLSQYAVIRESAFEPLASADISLNGSSQKLWVQLVPGLGYVCGGSDEHCGAWDEQIATGSDSPAEILAAYIVSGE